MLSGDNAVVIAQAARGLPAQQHNPAVAWGSGAAVVMRIALTIVAVELLRLPYLELAGAVLLIAGPAISIPLAVFASRRRVRCSLRRAFVRTNTALSAIGGRPLPVAQAEDRDLIVTGTRGPGTRNGALRGSVAQDAAPGDSRSENGIILNLLAFIHSESPAWPSNAHFPSSSPMR